MSYGFASNLRDALPNASFIGLTPSLPPLGRPLPYATHCLSRTSPDVLVDLPQRPRRPAFRSVPTLRGHPRQDAVQASGREHLRELLSRASGGVVFTTMNGLPPNVAATGSRRLRLRFPIETTKTGCPSCACGRTSSSSRSGCDGKEFQKASSGDPPNLAGGGLRPA
jgi:hypothetical protein